MALPDRLNHELNAIIRGDNYSIEFEFQDENENPIDLSGRSLYFTLKRHWRQSDEDAAAQAKAELSGTDAQAGKAVISLSPSDTDELVPGTYWYDLQLVTDASDVMTISRGRVDVVGDITRTAEL